MAAGNVIATLLVKIGVQFKEMNKGIKEAESKVKGLKGTFSKTAKTIGLIFGGKQILHGIKDVVKASNEFQLDLAKLNNTANLSVKDLDAVGNAAQNLAGKFGVSSNDIVHGLTELSKLGYDTADSLREMPQLLKFNVAAGTDFHTTIGLMETVLKDFDKELSYTGKASDIFSAAIAKGRLTANDLADTFKKAGLSGKNAGASVSDVAAAASKLAIKGFSGAEAGTSLNAIFGNLTKTGGTAQKKLKELGISVTDSSGKMRPFGEVVTDIQRKFEGLTDAQQNEAAQLIAGKEHMAKFLGVVSGAPGSFSAYSASLENADGATEKAFKGIDNTAAQSMNKLEKTFGAFQQKIGKAISPAVALIANAITSVLNWFNNLSPAAQTVVAAIGAIAAGILVLGAAFAAVGFAISALAPVWGALVTAWGVLSSAAAFLVPVFYAIGGAIGAITAPVWGIIAAITVLVAAFIYYWRNTEKVNTAVKAVWEGLVGYLSAIWDAIKEGVIAFGQFFVNIWTSIIEDVVAAFQWLYDHNYYFKDLVDFIVNTFNEFVNEVTAIWEEIKSFFFATWNWIKNTATTIWSAVSKAIMSVITALVNFIRQNWENLKNVTSTVFNAIKNTVTSIWSSISNTIKGWASQAYQWGANFLQMLINGIKSKVADVISTVKSIGSSIAKFLGFHSPTDKGPLSDSDKWMPNFMDMLEQGIETGIPRLEMAIGDVAATIATADTIAGSSSSVTNNINVSSRNNNLDERGLGRMLERMRILNGGAI